MGQTGRTTLVSSPYTWTITGDSLVTQGSAIADTATAVEAGGVSNGTAGTNPTGNVLTNDTGTGLTVVGVAAGTVGSASGSVGSAVTGMYGSINISSTGAYTYTVDNSNAAVQALRTTSNTLSEVTRIHDRHQRLQQDHANHRHHSGAPTTHRRFRR